MKSEMEIKKRLNEMLNRRADCGVALHNAEAEGAPSTVLNPMTRVLERYDKEISALRWVLEIE